MKNTKRYLKNNTTASKIAVNSNLYRLFNKKLEYQIDPRLSLVFTEKTINELGIEKINMDESFFTI